MGPWNSISNTTDKARDKADQDTGVATQMFKNPVLLEVLKPMMTEVSILPPVLHV